MMMMMSLSDHRAVDDDHALGVVTVVSVAVVAVVWRLRAERRQLPCEK